MAYLKYTFIIWMSVVFLTSCNKAEPKGECSFCYWKTNFSFSQSEREIWSETGANHLYLRYFDVDWNPSEQMAMPVSTISDRDTLPCDRFTPCVFLTNRVFEKSSKEKLDSLSIRIKKRILDRSESFASSLYYARGNEYDEDSINRAKDLFEEKYSDILIDCDWTERTKDNFFYFLEQMKKDFPDKEITSTLRLWQYNQRTKAGIPPVDRCLLMCYNMESANDYKVENSIASLSELHKYVSGEKYPKKLDLALPIFNWAILFRNERFVGLLGEVSKADYDNNVIEYEALGDGRYKLIVDKVIGNFFARKGDEIRVEMVSGNELQKMTGYLKSQIHFDDRSRITLFSWNELYIKNYGANEIKSIYTDFSK